MNLLLVKWDCYMMRGVVRALETLQTEYRVFDYILRDFESNEEFEEQLAREIKSKKTDAVFSINFLPVISKVCEKQGIRYISWGYDSPIKESAWKYLGNSCNEIYDFDRGQVEFFREKGITSIFHLPLAADTESFHEVVKSASNSSKEYFQSQVSFVGKLYTSDYDKFYSAIEEYTRGYVESCINVQKTVIGGYLIPDILTDTIYEKILCDFRKNGLDDSVSKLQVEYLLAQEAIRRNRFLALSFLSHRHEVTLYSTDNIEDPHVIQKGIVDYYQEMPLVFARSDINLNMSLNAIRTGIPLRALDIMGCGGFLLSNPQEELLETMKIGEECEVFNCIEELEEKVSFYLEHEEIRKQIAKNGLEKMKREFNFKERMKKMIK